MTHEFCLVKELLPEINTNLWKENQGVSFTAQNLFYVKSPVIEES